MYSNEVEVDHTIIHILVINTYADEDNGDGSGSVQHEQYIMSARSRRNSGGGSDNRDDVVDVNVDEQEEEEEEEDVLKLTVEIEEGRMEVVRFREGDCAHDVAQRFCQQHSVARRYISPLSKRIQDKLIRTSDDQRPCCDQHSCACNATYVLTYNIIL